MPDTLTLGDLSLVDSPACGDPSYAGYATAYYLMQGTYALTATETLEEMQDKVEIWADRKAPHTAVVRVPVIPGGPNAGRPVGTPKTAGGTWGGRCGATRHVPDPDRAHQHYWRTLRAIDPTRQYVQGMVFSHGYTGTSQAWWINGVSDHRPTMDGFTIECEQAHRHPGLCSARYFDDWDWRDYAPCAPNLTPARH